MSLAGPRAVADRSSGDCLIRPALGEEHRLLSRIAVASKGHWGYSQERMARWAPELSLSRGDVQACPTFVLERAGVVAAFYQLDTCDRGLELAHFWVLPEHMGAGLGRHLLDHALEQANALGYRELIIDADPNAEDFYRHCGAERIGVTPAALPGEPHRVRPLLRLRVAAD